MSRGDTSSSPPTIVLNRLNGNVKTRFMDTLLPLLLSTSSVEVYERVSSQPTYDLKLHVISRHHCNKNIPAGGNEDLVSVSSSTGKPRRKRDIVVDSLFDVGGKGRGMDEGVGDRHEGALNQANRSPPPSDKNTPGPSPVHSVTPSLVTGN